MEIIFTTFFNICITGLLLGRGGEDSALVCIYVKSMHEVGRLVPTIREVFKNGPFKIFVSVLFLALDSNREARTSRVFKIGIERKLVIYVEACVFIKNKFRTFKNYLTKNSPIVLVSNKISHLPARLTFKLKIASWSRFGNVFKNTRLTTTHCSVVGAVSTIAREV